jgi:hypothetical protein
MSGPAPVSPLSRAGLRMDCAGSLLSRAGMGMHCAGQHITPRLSGYGLLPSIPRRPAGSRNKSPGPFVQPQRSASTPSSPNAHPPRTLALMTPAEQLALALDPTLILKAQGFTPDPWQEEFLFSPARYLMLDCCRGAGKSRTTSALAVHHAVCQPKSLTLLVSRAQRQAIELFRYCGDWEHSSLFLFAKPSVAPARPPPAHSSRRFLTCWFPRP